MIDVVCYDAHPNFGDDLNQVLWSRVLPRDVMEREDVALFGIGSIFAQRYADPQRLEGKRVFVLGSGAGYAALPRDWSGWGIEAVRGPLTARLIGQPAKAATDAAMLLATVPDLLPKADRRDAVLFMPHYTSTYGGTWKAVCARAGMEYVDPSWDPATIFAAYARARLVITEAMHGAIVADTFRIPWIAVSTSNDILPFKWNDWCLSLNLGYAPHIIPPSSAWEHFRQRKTARHARSRGVPAAFETAKLDEHGLVEDFRRRYANEDPPRPAPKAAQGGGRARLLVRSLSSQLTWPFVDQAARALKAVAGERPQLSDDGIFAQRVEELCLARDRTVETIRAG